MARIFVGSILWLALLLSSATAQAPPERNADQQRNEEIGRARARISELKSEIKSRATELETEIKSLIVQLNAQKAELRAQLDEAQKESASIKSRLLEIEAQLADLQSPHESHSKPFPQHQPADTTPKPFLRFSTDIERAMLGEGEIAAPLHRRAWDGPIEIPLDRRPAPAPRR